MIHSEYLRRHNSFEEENNIMSGFTYNRQRALDYIYARGSDIEKARIKRVLDIDQPHPNIIKSIIDMQNADGGFPYQERKGYPSTLSNTTYTLVWLDDLGALATAPGRRAISYLLARQREDGSWDENPLLKEYNPPPWMKPGETAVMVFSTANSIFWLLMAGEMESALKGLPFLARHQAASGEFAGFRHNTWLAVAVFGMLKGWYAGEVRKGFAYLGAIPAAHWVTSQISWALWSLLKCGAPPSGDSLIRLLLQELRQRQRDDGSFLAEDGVEFAVNATIEALKVFRLHEKVHLVPGTK